MCTVTLRLLGLTLLQATRFGGKVFVIGVGASEMKVRGAGEDVIVDTDLPTS